MWLVSGQSVHPRRLLYSRLKLFLPVSALYFGLGLINYLRTCLDTGRLIAPEDA